MRIYGQFWTLNYPSKVAGKEVKIDHANPYPATALGTMGKQYLDGRWNLNTAIRHMDAIMEKDLYKSKYIGYSIHSDLGNNRMLYKSFGQPPKTDVSPIEFMGSYFKVSVVRGIDQTDLHINPWMKLPRGSYDLPGTGITEIRVFEWVTVKLPISWGVDLMRPFVIGTMEFYNLKDFQQWIVQYVWDRETSKSS